MHGIYTICSPLRNGFKIDFSASLLYNLYRTAQETNAKDRSRRLLMIRWGVLEEADPPDHALYVFSWTV